MTWFWNLLERPFGALKAVAKWRETKKLILRETGIFTKRHFLFFLKIGHSRSLFLYFRHIQYDTVDSKQTFYIKICRWLDSNHGPLVPEPTALPTEQEPLLSFSVYRSLGLLPSLLIVLSICVSVFTSLSLSVYLYDYCCSSGISLLLFISCW